MRKKNFSRKLHSILSITLSLVMLIGACFAVPATTAMAEGETITIDFENNNYGSGGSGLLGPVATTGPDGEATTAFKINITMKISALNFLRKKNNFIIA